MAQAAVKILKGFEDTPLTNDKAQGVMDWMRDLTGESTENDTSLKEVRVSFRKPYPMAVRLFFILVNLQFNELQRIFLATFLKQSLYWSQDDYETSWF